MDQVAEDPRDRMNLEPLTTIDSANTPKIPVMTIRLSAISQSVGFAKAGAEAMKAIARTSVADWSLVMVAILDVRTGCPCVRASDGGWGGPPARRTNATCDDALQ
jgi:hypothetical protein